MRPTHIQRPRGPARRQRGVVLVVAMIMLVIISLLAAFSIRNSVSNEAVSGNVRTTELATQAAEAALRYCEDAVVAYVKNGTALPGSLTIQAVPAGTPLGVNTANWDSATPTGVYQVPSTVVNRTGATATYQRVPECVVERMQVVDSTLAATTTTSTFQITARGFGPEVANGTGRPDGSEIFLQSTLEIQ